MLKQPELSVHTSIYTFSNRLNLQWLRALGLQSLIQLVSWHLSPIIRPVVTQSTKPPIFSPNLTWSKFDDLGWKKTGKESLTHWLFAGWVFYNRHCSCHLQIYLVTSISSRIGPILSKRLPSTVTVALIWHSRWLIKDYDNVCIPVPAELCLWVRPVCFWP